MWWQAGPVYIYSVYIEASRPSTVCGGKLVQYIHSVYIEASRPSTVCGGKLAQYIHVCSMNIRGQ